MSNYTTPKFCPSLIPALCPIRSPTTDNGITVFPGLWHFLCSTAGDMASCTVSIFLPIIWQLNMQFLCLHTLANISLDLSIGVFVCKNKLGENEGWLVWSIYIFYPHLPFMDIYSRIIIISTLYQPKIAWVGLSFQVKKQQQQLSLKRAK